jgi:hypothetical protein
VKKALVGLDKRHRSTETNLEAISQVVNRLDERLLNIEKMIAQVKVMTTLILCHFKAFKMPRFNYMDRSKTVNERNCMPSFGSVCTLNLSCLCHAHLI